MIAMPHFKKLNVFLIAFDVLTLVIWGLLVAEFITKGQINFPAWASSIYLLILAFYVTDKEIHRWRKKYSSRYRRGEYFVYLWAMTLVVMVGFCVWGGNQQGYHIPRELPTVAGAVIILYIITEYLKEEFKKR